MISNWLFYLIVAFVTLINLPCLILTFFIVKASIPNRKDKAEDRRKMIVNYPLLKEIPENITVEKSYFLSSRGARLFTQKYTPKFEKNRGKPKGIICYCHGYGDSSQWFHRDTAIKFCKKGYIFAILDHAGHGCSDGLHIHIPNFDHLVDDADEYFASVRRDHPGLKAFLAGESMGGAIVIRMMQKHRKLVLENKKYRDKTALPYAGSVLIAPMCKISDKIKPPEVVISFLLGLEPFLPRHRLLPSKDIIDKAFRVKEMAALARENPHGGAGYWGRLATGLCLLRVTDEIERSMEELTGPLLVVHGEQDEVTEPQTSIELYRRCGSEDKELKVYPGMVHNIFAGESEENKDLVWADIFQWLRKRS